MSDVQLLIMFVRYIEAQRATHQITQMQYEATLSELLWRCA